MRIVILLVFVFFLNFSGHTQNNTYKAPLYWSPYEHHILKEQNGVQDNYIPESEFLANINWLDANLKTYGYNMVCTDGWGDVSQLNENGYRKSHSTKWTHDFAWWSSELQSRGMTLGIYANPLWINVANDDTTTKIVGTNIPVSSLIDPSENALWFKWAKVDRPGAEAYVKGYIQFFADMGVKYLRVDFLSWFESGYDRNIGTVGPARAHQEYITALKWMREACDANQIYLSLVMPNLLNMAEVERQYGNLVRINEDTGYGSWYKFSDKDRGHHFSTWSQYASAFDGFVYWSQISGRDSVQLDGDFIRLNTFENDSEKKSVISLNILAGGPVTISDQYSSIGNDLWLYQNSELLELNADHFVAKPLSSDPQNNLSQTWRGQLSNGDWIIGFFNRETTTQERSIDFSSLGINGSVGVRDLWQHANLGTMSSISLSVPPHGCSILKLSSSLPACISQDISFGAIANRAYNSANFTPNATASSSLPIEFEIMSGPAIMVSNQVSLTGFNGTVYVAAKQSGNDIYCASIPKIQSFEVSGGHQPKICFAGSFNSWNLTDMIYDNGVWSATYLNLLVGSYEMKFANTSNWSGDDWGNCIGTQGNASKTTGGGANISFSVTQAGMYQLRFNDITLEYSITKMSSNQPEMFVGGTFNNWTLASNPMVLVSDNNWVSDNLMLEAGDYEMKFANKSDWSGDDWGNSSGLNGTTTKTTGGGANISFSISSKGNYKMSFNDQTLSYLISTSTSIGDLGELVEGGKIYPNPTTEMICLDLQAVDFAQIELTDVSGKKLYSCSAKREIKTIDVRPFGIKGLVIIKITSNNQSVNCKVVVK